MKHIPQKPFKHVTLARYGGLSMVRQKNNYGKDSFHSAPERYGFYAFVFPYIEMYLAYSTKENEINAGVYKKFPVKGGYIWTHLEPHDVTQIKSVKGSWFKVSVDYLPKLYSKYFAIETGYKYGNDVKDMRRFKNFFSPKNKSPYAYISKDHLEVFVCRDTVF
jgi:hypothetical protein